MNAQLASQLNSLLASFILLTAFGLVVQRRVNALLHLFAWQGLFLAVSTAIVGYLGGAHDLYISSMLTLAIKVALLPYILHRLIVKLKIHKEVETVLNIPATMLMGIVLVIFSYHLTAPIRELSTLVTRSTLAVALATVMLGFLMMITRKHAVTQIIGFLAMENGLLLRDAAGGRTRGGVGSFDSGLYFWNVLLPYQYHF
jgi:hydrogenase-4 component E